MTKDWLKLLKIKGVSISQKIALVNHFASPEAVFSADKQQLMEVQSIEAKTVAQFDALFRCREQGDALAGLDAAAESELKDLTALGATYLGFTDPRYPFLLTEIPSPPLGLFVMGDISLLQTPQIAMVGSRNPSPSGRQTTAAFARDLSRHGLTITSGMACGVDSDAHRGCLDVAGNTIAVIGTGLNVVYPKSNAALFRDIVRSGLVVSEYPLSTTPRREHFPQRNRIISGLSLGTLVMEAGMRSGSLITARLSTEQGREVFAVPGSIHLPTSRGCHHLIRQGAKLVETTLDIIDEIGQFFPSPNTPTYDEASVESKDAGSSLTLSSKAMTDLFQLIDYTPIAFDDLAELSGLTVDEISSILIDLELQGLIAESVNGYQRLPS